MEHDSSRTGYHEPVPGLAGLEEMEDDWGDDFPKTFSLNMIWAQAFDHDGREGAIGFEGGMPWHLPEDLKRFKELTVSHPIIMGRRTWESLNPKYRPLPNRDNIVISSNRDFVAPGAVVVDNIEDALDLARQEAIPDDGLDRSEIWVIGGARLFEELLPRASKLCVTQIDMAVDADTYAPSVSSLVADGSWEVTEESAWKTPSNPDSPIKRFRFVTYERVNRENDEEK
ncbi:diacylglycerol kinase [Bifidobacterium dolichotidis]|uniref:dihydrofolate reductase n=1 Tax=Bifidobacterium dolichotidis TaxID=2306976 RepID=A0A430FQ10_9BIFI|nr:dihydrofolate reductase [Bifidobacterium dolichotidis]RSX54908.1 diacylglycerol kinase [Bifidobacterium dolichotidis]